MMGVGVTSQWLHPVYMFLFTIFLWTFPVTGYSMSHSLPERPLSVADAWRWSRFMTAPPTSRTPKPPDQIIIWKCVAEILTNVSPTSCFPVLVFSTVRRTNKNKKGTVVTKKYWISIKEKEKWLVGCFFFFFFNLSLLCLELVAVRSIFHRARLIRPPPVPGVFPHFGASHESCANQNAHQCLPPSPRCPPPLKNISFNCAMKRNGDCR